MKINGRFILFTMILVVVATACKYFFGPDLDMSGFSPIFAIALFSGMIIKDRDKSFLLPLIALFISDMLIHFLYTQNMFPYAGIYNGQWKIYAILMLSTLIGWALKGRSYTHLLTGALAAPTVFFLVSNFLVWMGTTEAVYTKDFSGLMTCYTAALPFYKNALVATLLFLPAVLFLYNIMMERKAKLILA